MQILAYNDCQKGKDLIVCHLVDSRKLGGMSDDTKKMLVHLRGKQDLIKVQGFIEATCGLWGQWLCVQSCLCWRKLKKDLRCELKLQFMDTFFLCLTAAIHISCGCHIYLALDASFKWQMVMKLEYACPSAKNCMLLFLKATSPV